MKNKIQQYSLTDKNYLVEPLQFDMGELYQIGRMKCDPSREIPLHAHLNWFELTVVLNGIGTVTTNNVTRSVGSGDIYLSFPGEFHNILSDSEHPLDFMFFAFFPKRSDFADALEIIMTEYSSPLSRVFRNETVVQTVKSMLREITEPDEYFNEQFSSLLFQIQIYLVRIFSKSKDTHPLDLKARDFCQRIMGYVDTHLFTLESLSEVAEAMHYNYSYISSLFKNTMGETLQSYYCKRRLEAAKLLLAENNLSVTEISEILHYSSIYTFSRAYKDHFGTSPSKERIAQRQ